MTSVSFHLLIGVMFIAADCQPLITPSPENLCLGDLIKLNCSAQGSADWTSDDILGPGQIISFSIISQINLPKTLGNGTAVLIEKSPLFVTSLSFNLTTDRVETNCTDNQARTSTRTSSVQPNPNGDYTVNISYSMNISGGNFTWRPPSNIDDFLLREYRLTVECNDTVVIDESVAETTYSYDAERLIPGQCNATVAVINSCGDSASNSTSFKVVLEGGTNTVVREGENEDTTGPPTVTEEDEDSNIVIWIIIGIGVLVVGGLLVAVGILIIRWSCIKINKNKKKEGSQGFTQMVMKKQIISTAYEDVVTYKTEKQL